MDKNTVQPATKSRGAPLPDDLRLKLSALISKQGISDAMQRTGLSRGAIERALGGLGVYPGTVALVRLAVEQPQRPEASGVQS